MVGPMVVADNFMGTGPLSFFYQVCWGVGISEFGDGVGKATRFILLLGL